MRTSTGHRHGRADGGDLFQFDRAQQLHLEVERDFAHFVQEQRPAVRRLEEPLLVHRGTGERPPFVPEEFAFEEVLHDRAAVDRDKRPAGTLAVEVDRPRDELFPCPALAVDQHRSVRHRHLFDRVEDPLHGRALTDDLVEVVLPVQLAAQELVLQLTRRVDSRRLIFTSSSSNSTGFRM